MYIQRLLNVNINCSITCLKGLASLCQRFNFKQSRVYSRHFYSCIIPEKHFLFCHKRTFSDHEYIATLESRSRSCKKYNSHTLNNFLICGKPLAEHDFLQTRSYTGTKGFPLRCLNKTQSCVIKRAMLSSCGCFHYMSTTADSGDVSTDLAEMAKKVVEAARKMDVMVGSVPLTKVITLLRDLQGQKFDLSQMVLVLTQQPQLLREPESVIPITELLLSHGLKHGVIFHVLEHLREDGSFISLQNLHKVIDSSIKNFRLVGFTEKDLHHFLSTDPGILFYDSTKFNLGLSKLRGLFTNEDAFNVVRNSPNVLSDPWEETNEKWEYVYFNMGYKQPQMMESYMFTHSIDHIKDRHLFLVRAGFFHPVKEKDDPKLNPNPPLYEVIDSPDKVFAKKFGGVSVQEYKAYLRMREVEREDDNFIDDEEEDEDLHKNGKKGFKKEK